MNSLRQSLSVHDVGLPACEVVSTVDDDGKMAGKYDDVRAEAAAVVAVAARLGTGTDKSRKGSKHQDLS